MNIRRVLARTVGRVLMFASLLLAARGAAACSCIDMAAITDPALLGELVSGAEAVVHARVVAVPSAHEARIEVIESFKGESAGLLQGKPGASSSCGLEFRAGEEAVFLVYQGRVNLCGRQRATPDLLDRLRKLNAGP